MYRSYAEVLAHIMEDAAMLLETLPREPRPPFMMGLALMLAATRHTRLAMEAQGDYDPELNALCEQVAMMIVGQVQRREEVPAAFRRAFETDDKKEE